MRISGSDKNKIYSKYVMLKESSPGNTGSDTPSMISGINNIGNNTPKVSRSPIAALQGEVPETPTVGPASEDSEDHDENIEMAKSQLLQTADKAIMLFDLIHTYNHQLEPWAAAKLTLAADYIETLFDYMKYKDAHQMGVEPEHKLEPKIEVETDLG